MASMKYAYFHDGVSSGALPLLALFHNALRKKLLSNEERPRNHLISRSFFGSIHWRRARDSNPRYAINANTISSRAPSTARPTLRNRTRIAQVNEQCKGSERKKGIFGEDGGEGEREKGPSSQGQAHQAKARRIRPRLGTSGQDQTYESKDQEVEGIDRIVEELEIAVWLFSLRDQVNTWDG